MKIYTKGRNLRVTPALRAYAEEKIGHLAHYLDQILDAHVTLRTERQVQIVDVVLNLKHHTIKGEERSPDMYASIDLVRDRLEQQIRKFKTKHWAHHLKPNGRLGSPARTRRLAVAKGQPVEELDGTDKEPTIASSRQVAIRKMTVSEAVAQMELLGSDFYLFINDQTGAVNVLYKRRGGQLNLIETVS